MIVRAQVWWNLRLPLRESYQEGCLELTQIPNQSENFVGRGTRDQIVGGNSNGKNLGRILKEIDLLYERSQGNPLTGLLGAIVTELCKWEISTKIPTKSGVEF